MAGDRRLVIKNPLGLPRVDMLKTMFPDALFVFALRAPWPTIQSATLKGNKSLYRAHGVREQPSRQYHPSRRRHLG